MYSIRFLPESKKEYDELDGSARKILNKLLKRIQENPLPVSQGGYAKPLGSQKGVNLTNLLKIKLKNSGL